MDTQEKMEAIDQKAHSDLFEHGHMHEQMVNTARETQLIHNPQNPLPNEKNAALNAMEKIDPYAHLREKTQMQRKEDAHGWRITQI